MTAKVMRLVNPNTGKMECRICGAEHWANVRPDSNGQFYRGSWQCRFGCKLEKTVSHEGSKIKTETSNDALKDCAKGNL